MVLTFFAYGNTKNVYLAFAYGTYIFSCDVMFGLYKHYLLWLIINDRSTQDFEFHTLEVAKKNE